MSDNQRMKQPVEAPKPESPTKLEKPPKVIAPKSVVQFYKRFLDSASRYQMAEQTLQGARNQVQEAEIRLKGILEYLYGPDYTFEWDARREQLIVDPKGALKPDAPKEMKLETPPGANRATRRALRRVK